MSTISSELSKIPKKNFLSSYAICKNLVDDVCRAYRDHWEFIRRCQNHIQGERPVNYDELKKRGQGWCSNENFYKATGQLQRLTSKGVAEARKALDLSYVTFHPYDESKESDKTYDFMKDPNMASVVSSAIGYAFSATLSKENRLSDILNGVEYPSIAFGASFQAYYDDDWAPELVHPLNIGFKPQSVPENLPCWVIFKNTSSDYLWQQWEQAKLKQKKREEDTASGKVSSVTSDGWDVDALEEVLWRSYSGKINMDGRDQTPEQWADVLQEYNKNCSLVIQNTRSLMIAKIFYVELDGSISIIYIPYSETRDPAKSWAHVTPLNYVGTVDCRLFVKNIRAKQREKLTFVRDSGYTESTYMEDYRGIAKFAVSNSIRYNRTRNATANKVELNGVPFFERGNTQSGESFKLGVGIGYGLMPKDYTLAPQQPRFDIQSGIAYLAFEENEYRETTQHFESSVSDRLSSRPNRAEVQSAAVEVEQLNTSKNSVKFSDYSVLFGQMLKNLFKRKYKTDSIAYEGQKRFYDELKKLLPQYDRSQIDKILKCVDSYTIQPVIANISILLQAIQDAETPFARNRYKRMLKVAQGFPIEEVNINSPLINDKFTNYQDQRIALFENSDLESTNEVIVQGTDDHVVHLDTHLGKAQRIIEGYQQARINIDFAYKYLVNILAHSFQHIELLMRDRALASTGEQYLEAYKEFKKAENQMRITYEQQLEYEQRQAQQVQLDPETEADIARKNAATMSKEERANRQSEHRANLQLKESEDDKQIRILKEQNKKEVELAAVQQNEQPTVVNTI